MGEERRVEARRMEYKKDAVVSTIWMRERFESILDWLVDITVDLKL